MSPPREDSVHNEFHDTLKRAASPFHSGRPSALPVTHTRHRLVSPQAGAEGSAAVMASNGKETWKKLSVAQLRIVQWLETVGFKSLLSDEM